MDDPSFEAGKNNLVHRAQMLAKLSNIPAVRNNLDLINHFEVKGILNPKQLYEATYTDLNTEGLDGLVCDVEYSNIVSIIRGVNIRAAAG